MKSISDRSGNVSGSAAECLVYVMLRDGAISPGEFEELVANIEKAIEKGTCPETGFVFSNGWLARYAKDLVSRIEDWGANDETFEVGD